MSTNRQDDELQDDDPTDELPVLSEATLLASADDIPELVEAVDEPTGEHEQATLQLQRLAEPESAASRSAQEAAAAGKIEELEADIARIAARWSGVERELAEKDDEITALRGELQALERALEERAAAAEAAAADAAAAQALLDEQSEELRREQQARAAAAAESAALRETVAARDAELQRLRAELEEALAARAAAEAERQQEAQRDDAAALAAYIENRRSHWEQAEALAAARLARIGELERELEQRVARQQGAEDRMREELERNEELRAELVEVGRRLAAKDRELAGVRERPAADVERIAAELAEERRRSEALAAELATAERALAEARAAAERAAATSVPSAELERLEAELSRSLAEMVELQTLAGTREAERAELSTELAAARVELGQRHIEVEQLQEDLARLERALVEKDRALEARNTRLASLEQELDHKIAALQRLNALDVSLQTLDARMSERLSPVEPAANAPPGTPALICLTGDGPQRHALDKSVITIGRSAQCDIQILTHFISREHARLLVSHEGVVIEDLGSTNGVFVNAVRVRRHLLQHSDLVTVGETQFRFLEGTSH